MNRRDSIFSRISSIDPDRPETWRGRLFVTIDVDWASDEVLRHTVEFLQRLDIPATFFVTHETPVLRDIRADPHFELGIHPNFNHFFAGLNGGADADAATVVRRLLDVIPEARCVRSHSMTQSSRLLDLFVALGLSHDCNHFVPAWTGITLVPYWHWNGIVCVPCFWEDDVALLYRASRPQCDMSIPKAVGMEGLRVFDFHPIHIALNTPTMEHYENTRHIHRDWSALRAARYPGIGVETMLRELAHLGGA